MREKEIDFDLIYDKLETMKVEDKTRIICEDNSTENSQTMREEMLPFIQTYFNKLKTKSILTSNFSDDFLNLFDIVVFIKNSTCFSSLRENFIFSRKFSDGNSYLLIRRNKHNTTLQEKYLQQLLLENQIQ